MKKVTILFVLVFIVSLVWGTTTTIDFETEGSGYDPSATEGTGTTDVFNRSSVSDFGGNSSYIWAVEDLTLVNPSLAIDQINITGMVSFTFSIDFLTPTTSQWDAGDELLISYQIDGGSSQNLMWVQNRDDGTNNPAALDLDFDDTGEAGELLPAISDDFVAGVGSDFETFSTTLFAINGSTLDIAIQFNGLTSTDEGIYIDNILIVTSDELPNVIITEVADHSTYQREYVEIYNAGDSSVNIDGWFILERYGANNTSKRSMTLNSSNQYNSGGSDYLTLESGEYAVILRDDGVLASFSSDYSIGNNVAIFSDNIPSMNGNERYQLQNSVSNPVDYFGDWDRSPVFEVTSGTCYERINGSSSDGQLSSNWEATSNGSYNYTPGRSNHTTLPVTLSTFTAQYLNSKPTLYWQTQSEEDNMGWFIYRNTTEDFTYAEKITGMIDGHGTTTEPRDYIYEDADELQVEQTYYYWLESVDYSGTIHHFDRVAQITIPHPDDPGQNVTPPVAYDISADPNPFSHTTEITFAIDQTSMVDVAIYNVKGQLVKSFGSVMANVDEEVSFQWNGKDNAGKTLSNGVYLYSVKVNGKDYATKQLILMK